VRFLQARLFGGLRFAQHGIAQGLQLGIVNLIELDPKLENGHRQQLSRIPVTADDKGCLAFFKGCQNRVQSFF
jgi:hypothetical protein